MYAGVLILPQQTLSASVCIVQQSLTYSCRCGFLIFSCNEEVCGRGQDEDYTLPDVYNKNGIALCVSDSV